MDLVPDLHAILSCSMLLLASMLLCALFLLVVSLLLQECCGCTEVLQALNAAAANPVVAGFPAVTFFLLLMAPCCCWY
jgi:hypothetical protein